MGGQSAAEREEILSRARNGQLRLLYLAPERLRDPVVLAALAGAHIRQIVVDEAHCVALWGPSFRPDFLALPQLYARFSARPPLNELTGRLVRIEAALAPALSTDEDQLTLIQRSLSSPARLQARAGPSARLERL